MSYSAEEPAASYPAKEQVSSRVPDVAGTDAAHVGHANQLGAEQDSVSVAFTPAAYAVALQVAALKGIPVEQAISGALALQMAVTNAKSTGARLLLERGGHVEELVEAYDPDNGSR